MSRDTPGPIVTGGDRCTCTVCPLLCDDVRLSPAGVEAACADGRSAILAAMSAADASLPDAWEDGLPIARVPAIARAAAILAGARRVLVTGLADVPLEAIIPACDLAESLGAAVDAGLAESDRVAGPTIARAGEVTAAWEELRDRADLVLFWHADPAASHPRFIERFVEPRPAGDLQRHTIAVGTAGVMPSGPAHRHIPLPRHDAVEAARCLQEMLSGRTLPAGVAPPLAAACGELYEAIQASKCVAIITSDSTDAVGLEPWSIVHLVRTIAHERQAFQIPLGAGLTAGGANAAGAAAICTWRYGAAGAIARADRSGSRFLPAEATARRLVERGEVDAVLAVGRLSRPLEDLLAAQATTIATVRIDAASGTRQPAAGRSIRFRAADTSLSCTGTMLREDGRRVVLSSCRPTTAPQIRDLLVDLTGAVRHALASPAAGGRS